MLRIKILAILIGLLLAPSIILGQDIPKNPIALYNQAQKLFLERKHKEAKEIMEILVAAFPEDTGLAVSYLNAISIIDGKESQKAAARKFMPLYEAIPEANRDEKFYVDYIFLLRILGEKNKLEWNQALFENKFPKNINSKMGRLQEIRKEKDPAKAFMMFSELLKDDQMSGGPFATMIAEESFRITLSHPKVFGRAKVIAAADLLEQQALKSAEPDYYRRLQTRYLATLIKISDDLRGLFPSDSFNYLQKAEKYYADKRASNPLLQAQGDALQDSKLKSYISLGKWSEAQKAIAPKLPYLEKAGRDLEDEAELRADYAKILEGLKAIDEARKQFALAAAFDPKYKADWMNFRAKHPLAEEQNADFSQRIDSIVEANLKSREGQAKERIAKDLISRPAADFKISDLAGNETSLSDYRGKVLIVSFWATWCGPCKPELEQLKIAYSKYSNNPNIAFAIISTDEETGLVEPEAKKRGYNFPILLAGNNIEKDYGITAIPRFFVIDPKGNIRFDKLGFKNDGLFLKRLDWMIELAMK